jgi:hypothetical protein
MKTRPPSYMVPVMVVLYLTGGMAGFGLGMHIGWGVASEMVCEQMCETTHAQWDVDEQRCMCMEEITR